MRGRHREKEWHTERTEINMIYTDMILKWNADYHGFKELYF